jgi:hypothetical protein
LRADTDCVALANEKHVIEAVGNDEDGQLGGIGQF